MLRRFLNPDMSEPESGGQMPDTQRLNLEDYFEIMRESYGAIAADIAKLRAETSQAADRNAVVRVNQLNTVYQVPTGPWRSVLCSRPSYAEWYSTGGAFSNDLAITFDGMMTGILVYNGLSVIPYFGFDNFKVTYAAGTPGAAWAIDIFFTTRQYEFTPYTGY